MATFFYFPTSKQQKKPYILMSHVTQLEQTCPYYRQTQLVPSCNPVINTSQTN